MVTLLLLAGCAFISDERDAIQLDLDRDGTPKAFDCNDEKPGITRFDGGRTTLTCGSFVEEAIIAEADEEAGEVESIDQLNVSQCLHPSADGLLLQLSDREHIYRLEVDTPTTVDVHLDAPELSSRVFTQAPTHASLLANRGPVCERDTCVPGLPLRETSANAGIQATATFAAVPGETWYIIVSGSEGAYALDVTCGN